MFIMLAALNTAEAKKTITVSETVEIDAPAEVVWGYVSDFETWKDWTVWNPEADPEAVWTYEGEAGTVGHSTSWNGPELGEGMMMSTAVEPNTQWSYDLFFDGDDENFPGGVALSETGGVTTVTWSFNMEMGAIGAALFGKKIAEMISADFAGGLANLEEMVEADFAAAQLADAQAVVEAKAAAAAAAVEALTAAEETQAEAVERAAVAEEELGAARRKADKAAAQTTLDEAKAAHEAAIQAVADATAAAEAAATELAEAETALGALQGTDE
jgi:hypothetical protein